MGQAGHNTLNIKALLKFLDSADENHFEFSKFVRDAEVFCKNENLGNFGDVNLARYREVWFNLEIINALALDDWDSSGRPDNWVCQWNERYRHDAKEVIAELRVLLAAL